MEKTVKFNATESLSMDDSYNTDPDSTDSLVHIIRKIIDQLYTFGEYLGHNFLTIPDILVACRTMPAYKILF